MKRDMDLARSVLLAVDASPGGKLDRPPVIEGYDPQDIENHILLLTRAGFLQAHYVGCNDAIAITLIRLDWAGYEFIECIRNPDIWKATKDIASTTSGWTASLLAEIAKGLVRQDMLKIGIHLG